MRDKGLQRGARRGTMAAVLSWFVIGCVVGTTQMGCAQSTAGALQHTNIDRDPLHVLKALGNHESALIRCHAFEAMAEVAAGQCVEQFRYHLHDDYWGVRFEACIGLGVARDQASKPLVLKCVEDPSPAVQAAALYALHKMGDPSRTSNLAELLLRHKEASVRRLTAQLLGRLGEPKSIVLLKRAVSDRDHGVRLEATAAMARLGDTKSVQQLVYSASSGYSDEQTFAVLELALLGEPLCEEVLRLRLDQGPHLETKLVAARGLGRLGYSDGLRLALSSLQYDSPDVSARVAKQDPPTQQVRRVRALAGLALGDIGDPSALSALREVMHGDDPDVQVAAAKAIIQITDRDADAGSSGQPGSRTGHWRSYRRE